MGMIQSGIHMCSTADIWFERHTSTFNMPGHYVHFLFSPAYDMGDGKVYPHHHGRSLGMVGSLLFISTPSQKLSDYQNHHFLSEFAMGPWFPAGTSGVRIDVLFWRGGLQRYCLSGVNPFVLRWITASEDCRELGHHSDVDCDGILYTRARSWCLRYRSGAFDP